MPVSPKPSRGRNRSATILPSKIPPDVAKVLQQSLHISQIQKGFNWILENTSDEKNPRKLAAAYLKRYEEQVVRLKTQTLDGYVPTLSAALLVRYLAVLPSYRMKLANKGYNYVFLETWLKKKLLARILGIKSEDIERKIFLSGRKPPIFLSDELSHLIPMTCLARMRY